MDALQSLQALMKAPVIIDENIWRGCIGRRNKESMKNMKHLSLLLQELYKILLFNRDKEVYFFNLSFYKQNPIKAEIKLTNENSFFIAISKG